MGCLEGWPVCLIEGCLEDFERGGVTGGKKLLFIFIYRCSISST